MTCKTIDDWDQATIAEADAYHLLRGNSLWTGVDALKTAALYRAWDFLRGINWRPCIFDTELPGDILSAHIVAALEELKSPGVLAPSLTADNYLEEKNLAGAIIKKYRPNAPAWKRFRAIEVLIRPYAYSGACVELMRG